MLFYLTKLLTEIVLAVLLAVCAGYASHGISSLSAKVSKEHAARNYMLVSAVLGWLFVVVTIIAFVALVAFFEEIAESRWLRRISNSLMYVLIAVLFVIGILMSVAAHEIKRGATYASNKAAYKYASTSALIALISSLTILLIFGGIHIYMIVKHGSGGDVEDSDFPSMGNDFSDTVVTGLITKYMK